MKKYRFPFVFVLLFILTAHSHLEARVRNVILVIADGLGVQELGFAATYAHHAPKTVVPDRMLALERLLDDGAMALVMTSPHGALVADSAAAGTALACGVPTVSEALGVDQRGEPVESILESAARSGLATGLVTNTKLTHATPAAFYAHVHNRYVEWDIAKTLAASGIDVLFGGGLNYLVPRSSLSVPVLSLLGCDPPFPVRTGRKDGLNLVGEMKRRGYAFACSRESMMALESSPALGIFAGSHMPCALTMDAQGDGPSRATPRLHEMAGKAVELLARKPRGFFLMVEAGQIDFAGHNNDAGSLLHEILDLDRTLAVLLDWMKGRKDTVLILTADHETGGLAISYTRSDIPAPSSLPGAVFRDHPFKPGFNYIRPDVLDRIYAQRAPFEAILNDCDGRDHECTPERLVALFNNAVQFPITLEEAGQVLATEPNVYRKDDYHYISDEYFPRVDDFEAFYVYGDLIRADLLARIIAAKQGIAWSSGTHSAAPVLMAATGPGSALGDVRGLVVQTEVPRMIARMLGIDEPGGKKAEKPAPALR
ncbi:alkaline phosphatase [bacterium]|nr:alkaline phosphatase [candidate division CSSED10-310 bacterium]